MHTDSNSDYNELESPSQKNLLDLTNNKSTPAVEPMAPHGACRDKSPKDSNMGSILHPSRQSCSCEDKPTAAEVCKLVSCIARKFHRDKVLINFTFWVQIYMYMYIAIYRMQKNVLCR